jgi:hypothetical protein
MVSGKGDVTWLVWTLEQELRLCSINKTAQGTPGSALLVDHPK